MGKLSKTKVNELVKSQFEAKKNIVYPAVDGNEIIVEVRRDISFEDFCKAVNELADMQFAVGADGEQIYVPYLDVFAEGYVALKYFTNISVDIKSDGVVSDDSKDVERIWEIIRSPIMADVTNVIGSLWSNLCDRANQIVHRRLNAEKNSRDKMWDSVAEVVSKYAELLNGMSKKEKEDLLTHLMK